MAGLGLLGSMVPFDAFQVWVKGRTMPGWDETQWRLDDYGNMIKYSDYGDRNSPYGWEKDHIIPTARGGSDELYNLRPLHHRTNASLGGLLGAFSNR